VKREDLEDRLIHVLLCEHLGGEAPPDLVPRVLAAMPRREWARRLRALAAVVALAVVAVGAAVWWAGSRYPGPALAGDYALVGSEGLGRGAEVEAGARGARLSLGGYCAVTLAPGSRVVVGGAPKDEEIALKRGEVTCEVARGRGRFRVVTDLGTVSVAGTRFLVRLEEGGGQMNGRRLYVKVLAGTVLLATAAASETLGAGEERTVGPKGEGRIVATFLETGRDAARFWVKVQKVLAGDPALKGRTLVFVARPVKDGERWMPDPEQTALFRRFRRGDVLEIAYVTDEHYRVRSARLLERAGGGAPGLIEAGKGEYVRREGEKWREQGRIIGRLRNAPDAEMDALNATGAVVRSLRIRKGARNYEPTSCSGSNPDATPSAWRLRATGRSSARAWRCARATISCFPSSSRGRRRRAPAASPASSAGWSVRCRRPPSAGWCCAWTGWSASGRPTAPGGPGPSRAGRWRWSLTRSTAARNARRTSFAPCASCRRGTASRSN